MKLDILAFAAHPDDVEISASGTLMKHIDAGKKAGICDFTRGELGSRGSAELRDTEAAKAAEIMKLAVRTNLGLPDGFFAYTKENIILIAQQIRFFQPEIVIAPAVDDRHPDHGRASKMVSDACFYAGLTKIETEFNGAKQESWRTKTVYHYIQDRMKKADFIVDISDYFERKMESIYAYSSQFYDPNSQEPKTPISTPEFLEFMRGRASELGRLINKKYGEGFTVERTPGVNSLFDLI